MQTTVNVQVTTDRRTSQFSCAADIFKRRSICLIVDSTAPEPMEQIPSDC